MTTEKPSRQAVVLTDEAAILDLLHLSEASGLTMKHFVEGLLRTFGQAYRERITRPVKIAIETEAVVVPS